MNRKEEIEKGILNISCNPEVLIAISETTARKVCVPLMLSNSEIIPIVYSKKTKTWHSELNPIIE